ncbi:iron chaperone [Lunatibacter salilacus]|uniref:iron chaperone n=1 Tax=Lunatibacter salilacus TaxID=2483804 RepID=UPI0018FEF528|nr:DUF1801 domain-containing protein [Lunatibacter salilacus]
MMTSISDYIAAFPTEVQEVLTQLRTIILETVPDAEEGFAYQMPSFKTHGKPLVYFAAFKNHIGLYATPTGHDAFKERLAGYKQGKGSVQFPLNQPIPYDLIREIVLFRMAENKAKYS